MAVRPGDVLAGKYRIERVLGAGGMGVVAAAEHIELHERVALKLMLPEALENPEAVERFLREARAAVKIKGEHVAKVTDVGRLEGGEPYIVMEYLEGDDLSAVLARRGTLPVEEAIEYVLQACEAIAEAHTLGIIHRDLKPSNLFLTQRPDGSSSVKVLDFGISKVLPMGTGSGSDDVSMTRTKQPLGTPLYMPPEQMASARSADTRSDIWSLGIILFELITGEPPFNGGSFHELRRKIAQDPAPSIRAARPTAPRGLDPIVRRCLEKEASKRFQNVADFAAALAEIGPKGARQSAERIARMLEKAGLASTMPHAPAEESSAATPTIGAANTLGETRAGRGRSTRVAGIAALLVAAVVTAALALNRGTPGAPVSAIEPTPSAPSIAASPPAPQAEDVLPAAAPPASAAPIATPTSTSAASSRGAAPTRKPTSTSSSSRAGPAAPATATAAPAAKPKDMLTDAEIK
jgi:serine/threonine-protein kinase